MTPSSFIAINVTKYGLVLAGPTALFVINFLIVTVALTVTGLLMVICIRAIWTVLWNGSGYGFWPGLRKWIGKKSTLTQNEQEILLMEEANKIWEEIQLVSGVPEFMKGPNPFSGVPVIFNENVPPGTLYLLNGKYVVADDLKTHLQAHLEMAAQLSDSPSESLHPKLRKYPEHLRGAAHNEITALLREYLEPIHMEGGETWLEVKDPSFSFDILAEEILEALDMEDRP